jgi:predicted glycogen debranching enzyme
MNRAKKTSNGLTAFSSPVDFGRDVCGDLPSGEHREWLVTNGLGGFASGTVAGLLTRRYHGLLVAALKPPLGRTLLVAKLDETAEYAGRKYFLATNRWGSGSVEPQGWRHIERFRLEGTTPVWTFAIADALLEKRVWMQRDANTTYVRYTLLRAGGPVHLALKPLINYRDYHSTTHANGWRMNVEPVPNGLRVLAFDGAAPFYLLSGMAVAEPTHSSPQWDNDFQLAQEAFRGLDDRDDHLEAGTFSAELLPGESLTWVASTDASANLDGESALEEHDRGRQALLGQWSAAQPEAAADAPAWIRQLVLAADQFIVRRPLADDPEALSVIAGYPWFGDWGRDTMIALPGLTLAAGRPEITRRILRTFARFVDQGMLPNVFPDAGEKPEYNTVDAALWYFEAVRQYYEETGDAEFLREIFPALTEMIEWHQRGTRYGIKVDPRDGLLAAGEAGVQLTWMDAKVGDWVVTPRIGKPVEVNALWYNALAAMARFATILKLPASVYSSAAWDVERSFGRFWNEEAGCCFDVIDGPDGKDGKDASLRPNQILAVSLPASALSSAQQCRVVDACARELVTSHGLRSLAAGHPAYVPRYGGGPRERDGAYHQGTVWGWLLGHFALAYLRVYNDPAKAASYLEPMAHHLNVHGLGSASEIFDAEAPFTPRGCTAQAWTVAEILRAWTVIRRSRKQTAATPPANGTKGIPVHALQGAQQDIFSK